MPCLGLLFAQKSLNLLAFKPTDEICAVLKLDNSDAGQTSWKPAGSRCWNESFFIDLDKVSEICFAWFLNSRKTCILLLEKSTCLRLGQ